MYPKKIIRTFLVTGLALSLFGSAFFKKVNTDIVLLGYTNDVGQWQSLPGAVPEGQQSQGNLVQNGEEGSVQGSLIYGLAQYCSGGEPTSCDLKYQFTLTIANNSCAISQTEDAVLDVNMTIELNETILNCAVSSTLNQLPIPTTFSEVSSLKTSGIVQWEHFEIDGNHYLAAANAGAVFVDDINNNNIFKFNGTGFENFQGLANYKCSYNGVGTYLKDHGFYWHHFEVNNQHWLAMANNYRYDEETSTKCIMSPKYNVYSYLYPWEGNSFDINNLLGMLTDSATLIESYNANGKTYIAVAGQNIAGKGGIMIYEWNGKDLDQPVSQPALAGFVNILSMKNFTYGNQTYLIVNRKEENTLVFNVNSSGQLTVVQEISTPGSVQSLELFFDVYGNPILLVGYAQATNADPKVLRWDNNAFAEIQSLNPEIFGFVQAWSHFTLNGTDYVAAISGSSGELKIYEWSGNHLETRFPYYSQENIKGNIVSVTAFVVNNNSYLALARKNDESNNKNTVSPILKWSGF